MDGQTPNDGTTPAQSPVADQSAQLPPITAATPAPSPVAPAATQPTVAAPSLSATPPPSQTTPADSPVVASDQADPIDTMFDPDDVVTWTASEFIEHHKNAGWYTALLLVTIVASVGAWFLTHDFIATGVVVLAGACFAAYASRRPRQLTYQLDPSGLIIDRRHYSYNEFKSFSVVPEGAFNSIVFTPLKRFGIFTTIYYAPPDEAAILGLLSQRLPHEERQPDMVEGLMRRIRF